MLRPSEIPLLPDLLSIDEDAALDASPEWFVPELMHLRREEREDDGLGLRSLLERPEALASSWQGHGWHDAA